MVPTPPPDAHFGCRVDHAGHQPELVRQAVATGEPAYGQDAGSQRGAQVIARRQRPRHHPRGFALQQMRAGCRYQCTQGI